MTTASTGPASSGIIEMKLRTVSQLFNTLDPAPFRERDLAKEAENYIVDPIQLNLNKYTMAKIRRDAQIATSTLGQNAGLMGTVAMVMNKVFQLS